MTRADHARPRALDARGAKRAVVVAENVLIVAAIRSGVREAGALALLGYVDPRQATAARLVEVEAEVVLVDEGDGAESTFALIRDLKDLDESIRVIVLALDMEGAALHRALEAGADGAISKAVHPTALATLVREVVDGHIVHAPLKPLAAARCSLPVSIDHDTLTEREREILQLVASGSTNAEIARQLWVTQQTVKFHVSNIYRKLGVANRTEACHYAHIHGLAGGGADSWVQRREPAVVAC